ASTANLLKTNGWQAGAPFTAGTPNFEVAMREWNHSEVYRKTIVLMAQRISGGGGGAEADGGGEEKVGGAARCPCCIAPMPQGKRSIWGRKQTSRHLQPMSALPPKADIAKRDHHVRFVPKADSCDATKAVGDGAHSGRRATDQPHRTGEAY